MAASTKEFSTANAEAVLAADANRDFILLQLYSSANLVYLAFGEDAVDATGIALMFPGDWVKIKGPKARLAVSGIDADGSALVGIETMEEIEYGSGQFAGPWPLT